jgi:hypothetical protein
MSDPRDMPVSLAQALLAQADLGELRQLTPLTGGANNRVFKAEAARGPALLKLYFRHPSDPRDRLMAELALVRLAWSRGIRAVPRPLADDPAHGAALYEFIPGRPLTPDAVNARAVAQALDFYLALNRWRDTPEAAGLPEASEACYSLSDHLACVDQRVRRLCDITPETALHRDAGRLAQTIGELWGRVQRRTREEGDRGGLAAGLGREERRLSPSDFGFHNALHVDADALRFVDFEYAGWDDPAKTVCDFFCQPALPVPRTYYEAFAGGVLADQPSPELHRRRADLLLPVYRVKWCCILLNEFLPIGGTRRGFASTSSMADERLTAQLAKARVALQAIQ